MSVQLAVALCIGAAFFWALIDAIRGSPSERRMRRKYKDD